MHWMFLPFRRYAEFSGRSRRMEYWMFALLNAIVMVVIFGAMFAMRDVDDVAVDPANPLAIYGWMFSGVGVLLLLWFLAVLVPSIAVSVRRLHDRDMSGWWYLGFVIGGLIPYIGLLISLAFLVIMLLPGTPGPNRFGEDPKGGGASQVFE